MILRSLFLIPLLLAVAFILSTITFITPANAQPNSDPSQPSTPDVPTTTIDSSSSSSSSFEIITHHPIMDAIFDLYKDLIGAQFPGYRNHCYRVYNLALAAYPILAGTSTASPLTTLQKDLIALAVACHDIGIWTDNSSFAYLDPSAAVALKHLDMVDPQGAQENKILVQSIVQGHHKFTSVQNKAVEAVRVADLCDFSMGVVKLNGVLSTLYANIVQKIPYEGFHQGLALALWNAGPIKALSVFKIFKW